MRLHIFPITLKEANALITCWHRHHKPVPGAKFAVGVKNEHVRGAAICGRPVARMTDPHTTLEVMRLVTDGTPNACSILYAACARIAETMGYRKIQTFILATEPGTSVRAAGWQCEGLCGGGSWSRPSRCRLDEHPLGPKQKWSKLFNRALREQPKR